MTMPATNVLCHYPLQPQQVQPADDAPVKDRHFIGLWHRFDMKPR
jgi:hypothetical protein